jgi:hypothetical protein
MPMSAKQDWGALMDQHKEDVNGALTHVATFRMLQHVEG